MKINILYIAIISAVLVISNVALASEYTGTLSGGGGQEEGQSPAPSFTVTDQKSNTFLSGITQALENAELPLLVKIFLIVGVVLEIIALIIIDAIKKRRRHGHHI